METCGCIPWNFPHPRDNVGNIELCDGIRAHCFQNQMEQSFDKTICDCPANCNEMRFDVTAIAYPINAEKECSTSNSKFIASCRQNNSSNIRVENDINVMIAERLR